MPKTRPPYSAEFRQQMVKLVAAGRTPEELSREFEPSAPTIRQWAVQAARDAGERQDGPTTAEQEELRRLRRENKQLRLERKRPPFPHRSASRSQRSAAAGAAVGGRDGLAKERHSQPAAGTPRRHGGLTPLQHVAVTEGACPEHGTQGL